MVHSPPVGPGDSSGGGPASSGKRSLARSILAGTGMMAAAGFAAKLFGLLSSPILTRLVGPSPYGVVALAGTISSLATTVAMMGVDLSYTRYFFEGGRERRDQVERFCWRFAMGAGTAMSFLAGCIWWRLDDSSGAPGSLAILVAASTFLAVGVAMATTRRRVRGEYSRIAAATASGAAIGVPIAVLLAWLWRADAVAMLSGALLGSVTTAAILGVPQAKTLLSGSGLDGRQRRDLLGMGFAAAVTAPMFWVMNSADRWFLGAIAGPGPLGVYSFAAAIGLSGTMVIGALTTAWFPEMSREYESFREGSLANIGRLWGRFAAMHMVTWLAVTAAGGDLILLMTDRRFHDGAPLVPWIAGGVFFYGMAALANTGLFLQKTQAPTAAWWIVGAVSNVACNAVLVGPLGPMGAALAACLGFALIAAGMIWSAQSRLFLPIPWGKIVAAGALTLVAGVLMSPHWGESPVRSLMMKFPGGVAVAAIVMGIVAPDWLRRLAHRAQR